MNNQIEEAVVLPQLLNVRKRGGVTVAEKKDYKKSLKSDKKSLKIDIFLK